MSRRKEPATPSELLDQLLAGGDAAAALAGSGLLDALKKTLAERALNAEMDHHLGQESQAGKGDVNGLVTHHSLVANLHPDGVEEQQRPYRVERPSLPRRHFL
jgi:hypothetical protein